MRKKVSDRGRKREENERFGKRESQKEGEGLIEREKRNIETLIERERQRQNEKETNKY